MNSDRLPRVLVTRAAHQASTLGDALSARGMLVVSVPAIALEEPSDGFAVLHAALAEIDTFDWLVFTSANAVEVFAEQCEEVGVEEVPCRIASIGEATSRALRSAGMQVSLQPGVAVAEELLRSLLPHVRGRSVLLVRAEVARDLLPQQLARAGATVTIAPVYRTVVPRESAEALRREMPHLSAITLASSSAVRNLIELCDAAGIAIPPDVVLASIGPITSATLRECGYAPSLEASAANVEVLASELARHLGTKVCAS